MTRTHAAAAVLLTAFALLLAACGGGGSSAADEAAIRDANKKWLELIVAKDAKGIANDIYAEDGAMLPPNAPKAAGREAVQKGWEEMFKIPNVTLTFETERFVIAKSGDVAVDIGTYKFGGGGMTDTGKSVVTWTKKDGKWQVLTDMFSSDAPPPPPAPAATAPAGTGATPGPAETGPAPATPAPTTTPAPTHP